MSLEIYLAYVAAVGILVAIPGPTVTLVVGNSLRYGVRAGLLNVVGNLAGLAVVVGVVGFGLASFVKAMGWWFDWLRLVGAVYLVWLGLRLLRSPLPLDNAPRAPRPSHGFVLQGFLVALSNPKTLFFFGAFLPQFINPRGNTMVQLLVLGVTTLIAAAIGDSSYAALAGRAGTLIARRRIGHLTRASGLCLIGGGAWLALTRSR